MGTDNPFRDPYLVDVTVPEALVGRPPPDTVRELEVNAWGPFQVYLEDAPTRPAYVGSRLRFEAGGGQMLVRFWPVGLEPDKVYVLRPGEAPLPLGNVLKLQTVDHGVMTVAPVPETDREAAAQAARLT